MAENLPRCQRNDAAAVVPICNGGFAALPYDKLPSLESLAMSRKTRIEEAITTALAPLHLEVTDESHMHNVPPGAESHFKVLVVSEAFAAENPLARHRRVNGVLAGEFRTGLHALAIHAWTPEQWYAKGGLVPESPQCMGGSKVG